MKYNNKKLNQDFLITRRSKEIEKGSMITLEEIANELGLNISTMNRARRESIPPSLHTLAKLCKWMGTEIHNYLIDED